MLAQIVLFDGFDPLDVIAPYEVLTAGGVTAGLVSAEGAREVPSGLPPLGLRATGPLEPARADLVVVPGAAAPVEAVADVLRRALGTGLPALLGQCLDRPGVTTATVCGGSLVLALAGLIPGRPATTHRLGRDLLADAGATPVRARVVDDGDLVTSGGVTSGLDLGLYLLEREFGARAALAVEDLFEHERRGTVWRSGDRHAA
ncbi:DJ-1/PfpI family protein [Actinosynnema sp. NPDC050436]|uniref:DJ-1/PfpI family protein n=1 Tax=Actinosynnema sp. NPDC050436 TaxID=3155659 RepID=UPI0033FA2126